MTSPVSPVTASAIDYDEAIRRWEPVVGLETHVELGTASKMFCGCPTEFGAEPNTHVCPVCLGLPGSLPVVNEAAVRFTVMIGLALNATIAPWCRFARKNYFYPDMPKDYQISQYDEPLCVDGWLDVTVETVDGPTIVRVEIERVHMEEDTGKSLHVGGATGRIHGATHSLVDYNRAGIPLIEIVTRPIPNASAAVARAYVEELATLLRGLGVSDVRMEQGSLRCDVNVSLRPREVGSRGGDGALGTRSETKNVNSFRSVERAVRSEVERQAGRLERGERIVQETRHFHEDSGTSSAGRSKEEATDYRYFPEPDLVPLALAAAYVEDVRASLPELPAARRTRLAQEHGFTAREVAHMSNAGVVEAILETIAAGATAGEARNWWMNELAARANEAGVAATDLPITPLAVARIAALVGAQELSVAMGRQVLDAVLAGEGDPDAVVADRGLRKVSDTGALQRAADAAIAAHPEVADKIRGGKLNAVGALVGAVMKETQGQADAAVVKALLLSTLGVDAN